MEQGTKAVQASNLGSAWWRFGGHQTLVRSLAARASAQPSGQTGLCAESREWKPAWGSAAASWAGWRLVLEPGGGRAG